MELCRPTMSDVDAIRQRLLAKIKQEDYAGFDPYDGLNSRLFKAMGLGRYRLARLAWIQLFKRSPVNLRPMTGVPKRRNPKGIALIIMGMLQDHARSKDKALLEDAQILGNWLLEHACVKEVWEYACWGYPFPWQARAFFVPIGTPNLITTCYVARALWALWLATGLDRYADAAYEAAWFIAKKLYVQHDGRRFLAYIPGENAFVHNANLWGAAILAQAYRESGKVELADKAYEVAMQSVSAQHTDGSWAYGTRSHHGFIDSFHTGFNLQALHIVRKQLQTNDFEASIQAGMNYYRNHFFLKDGTPKYYYDSIYPIDIHSVAQAVITLLEVGGAKEDYALARKVLDWAVKHMYCPQTGWFYYHIHRMYRNKIPYLRWTQAWAYLALATYAAHERMQAHKRGGVHG